MRSQAQHPSDVFPSPGDPGELHAASEGPTSERDGTDKPVPPHLVLHKATSPGKPSFDAVDGAHVDLMSPTLLQLAGAGNGSKDSMPRLTTHKASDTHTPLSFKIRGCAALLMLAGLLLYELTSFEWKDWRDQGEQPGVSGFTGPALLWALSALWALSQVYFCGLHYTSSSFRNFSAAQQLKVVKYLIQITWGSIVVVLYVILQLYFDGWLSSSCTANGDSYAGCAFAWTWPYTHIVTLYGAMYVWELIHEGSQIHNSLALHHLCIVVVWHLAVGYYGTREDLSSPQLKAIGDIGFPQLVAAGIEQPVFTALLMHRFGARPASRTRAFQVAWVSFGAMKVLALVASVAVIIAQWSDAPLGFSLFMVLALFALVPTQAYSTIVLRRLAHRMFEKNQLEMADKAAAAATA